MEVHGVRVGYGPERGGVRPVRIEGAGQAMNTTLSDGSYSRQSNGRMTVECRGRQLFVGGSPVQFPDAPAAAAQSPAAAAQSSAAAAQSPAAAAQSPAAAAQAPVAAAQSPAAPLAPLPPMTWGFSGSSAPPSMSIGRGAMQMTGMNGMTMSMRPGVMQMTGMNGSTLSMGEPPHSDDTAR